MQFGLILPNFGPAADREGLVAAAQAAEASGFDSIWSTDHLLPPTANREPYGHLIEALISLAYLAPLAPRVRLGTSIIVLPQRNPIIVAKQAAALDVLSGGRLTLGLGTGWLEREFQFLGADFHTRGRRMDEYIQAMRVLWTEPSPAFHGQFVNFEDTVFQPKPAQAGGIPIWVGGNSEAALRRAARLGDGWQATSLTLEEFAERVPVLREMAGGRPLTVGARTTIDLGGTGTTEPSARGGLRPKLAGDRQQILDGIGRFAGAGMQYMVCQLPHRDRAELVDRIAAFASEVMPAFKS